MRIGQFFKSMLEGGRVDVTRRYEVLREGISGTMSNFHMARDRQTGQVVGLKILDKQKTSAFEARFRGLNKPTEGEIATTITHEHVVKTYTHGLTTENEQFLVMEFLDGPGLNSLLIGRSALLDGNRLNLIRQAAQGLEAVHQAGFIHRDICPRNFVCRPDATSLTMIDFGLSVPAQREYLMPGNRTGTPNYMAPEVVRRRSTDHRLDIFAFGVSMYELFAFDLPWQRGTDGLAAMAHGLTSPSPIHQFYPKIDRTLEAAILKCIEADPEDRFSSMTEFLRAIRSIENEDVEFESSS